MPLYEYECLKCGHRFEEIQKFSDEPLTEHNRCGGELRKLLSAPAIQFKGTGWYITDYARAGQTDGDGKQSDEKKTEAKPDSGSETKTESKPESKSNGSGSSSKTSSDSKH